MSSRKTASVMAILGIAAIVVAVDARVPRSDVNEVVRRTKALYDATTSADVGFEQTGAQGSTSGSLQFASGNRYRLEFPKQTIVSNGTTVWTYTPQRRQVIVSKASARRGGLTPGEILTKFPGSYRPTMVDERSVDGRQVWVVRCDAGPEKIGDVTSATLYIDKSTYRFVRIELVSPSMGALTLRITRARYNVAIAESRFQFTPPTGTRVVKL